VAGHGVAKAAAGMLRRHHVLAIVAAGLLGLVVFVRMIYLQPWLLLQSGDVDPGSWPVVISGPGAAEREDVNSFSRLESWLADPLLGDAVWQQRKQQCGLFEPRPVYTPNAFYLGFRMPDFIIAGFQKSGTSTLVEFMIQEFKGLITVRRTESGYFSTTKKFKRGVRIYSHAFLRTNDSRLVKSNALLGEKSTDYMFTSTFPLRVVEHNPRIKIVVIMREPSSRALSEFKMRVLASTNFVRFRARFRAKLMNLPCARRSPTRRWALVIIIL